MEYRIDVDPTSGWGRVTVSGDVALEGLGQLLKAAWTDPEYSRIETALWNFLDARTSMRLEDLMQLKAWISGAKGDRGARTIALVAADDVIFGVGRMFHAVQPEVGWKVSIFREESEAIAWLKARRIDPVHERARCRTNPQPRRAQLERGTSRGADHEARTCGLCCSLWLS